MNGYEPSRNRSRLAATAQRGTILQARLREEGVDDLGELMRLDDPRRHAHALELRAMLDRRAS